eukprot:3947310-Pyramimonas_sp.AAC.2
MYPSYVGIGGAAAAPVLSPDGGRICYTLMLFWSVLSTSNAPLYRLRCGLLCCEEHLGNIVYCDI